MSSETALYVDNLSKRYRRGAIDRHSLYMDIRSWWRKKTHGDESSLASDRDEFWALKDISFEVPAGQVLGLIGKNGAGKSTLLKILSRITSPTSGRVTINGKMSSLLEVGTGFHQELTGRENIYLNGAILGMSRSETRRKFDEIMEFAEINEFIDTPVKHYSSGMFVRLAFAVAAHLEPDILLVDEVLAVGDVAFQRRCLGKIGEATREGRTVVFVSHNTASVRSLCDRVIWLDKGSIVSDGEASEVLDKYVGHSLIDVCKGEISWGDGEGPGGAEIRLKAVRLIDGNGEVCSVFDVNSPIIVEIYYEVKTILRDLRIRVGVLTPSGEVAFESTDHYLRHEEIRPGSYRSVCTIPGALLNIGQYTVRVGGGMPGVKMLLPHEEYLRFATTGIGGHGSSFAEVWPGAVCPKLDWVIEKIG